MKEKVIFCWSSGKDSALALYRIFESQKYEVACLLTTITEGYQRVGMHGVSRRLVKKQADALSLILEEVFIPQSSSLLEYEFRMYSVLSKYSKKGVKTVVFGDIFLQDLKKYRVDKLAKVGMRALFPLWKEESTLIVREFIDKGFKAIVTCVDSHLLGKELCGEEFDARFLSRLPKGIDPCGENGEFHTFVYSAPLFKEKLNFKKGKIVFRENRFYFCDLLLPEN